MRWLGALAAAAFSLMGGVGHAASGTAAETGVVVAPSNLPAQKRVPVNLGLEERVDSPGPTHPSATREIVLDLDRDVAIDATGVPACRDGSGWSIRRERGYYERLCRGAGIGTGRVEADIDFGGWSVTRGSGVRVYNGGVRSGVPTIFLFMYFEGGPAPGPVVATVRIGTDAPGAGYRQRLKISVPKIAGGAGSVTRLDFTLNRRTAAARCPDRRLRFRAATRFYGERGVSGSAMTSLCGRLEEGRRSAHGRRYP